MFGFAAIVSRREGYLLATWPTDKALYGMSVATILMGIAVATLEVTRLDDMPGWDKIIVFLSILLQSGLLTAGIIAGFGALVSVFNPRDDRFYCSSCDNDVRDDWKLCPHCGDTLEETA